MVACFTVDLGSVELGERTKELGLDLRWGEKDGGTGQVEGVPVRELPNFDQRCLFP